MTLQFVTGATRRHPSWHFARAHAAQAIAAPATRSEAPRHAESALSKADLARIVAGMID